jgi:hypothetical protein
MTDEVRRPPQQPHSDQARSPHPQDVWDRFIDELDRRGQAGSAADVLTPTALHAHAPSGKRFADLSREEIDNLASIGSYLGRRGDVVKTIWEQTQRQIKPRRSRKR